MRFSSKSDDRELLAKLYYEYDGAVHRHKAGKSGVVKEPETTLSELRTELAYDLRHSGQKIEALRVEAGEYDLLLS